jgi:hypothetical protein
MKTSTIVWSLAFAIVASAFAFRGATEYWVEAGLIITAVELVILRERIGRSFASCNVPGRVESFGRKIL